MDTKGTTVEMPPAYVVQSLPNDSKTKGKTCRITSLVTYAVTITVLLVVLVILGSVYYYRSLDVIQSTFKKYELVENNGDKTTKENVEIDVEKQIIVFRLNGQGIADGTYAVLDYTKSMTGLYDPGEKTCYLIGGIRKEIVDPKTLSSHLEKNETRPTVLTTLDYKLADDYPIGDKTILPAPMQQACKYLPTYWLDQDLEEAKRDKRAWCIRRCWKVWRVTICAGGCIGFGK